MCASSLLQHISAPSYLNRYPQLSLKTGLALPTNTFDPSAPDVVDGDIPGFGSKAALDDYTQGKGRKSVGECGSLGNSKHTRRPAKET